MASKNLNTMSCAGPCCKNENYTKTFNMCRVRKQHQVRDPETGELELCCWINGRSMRRFCHRITLDLRRKLRLIKLVYETIQKGQTENYLRVVSQNSYVSECDILHVLMEAAQNPQLYDSQKVNIMIKVWKRTEANKKL